MPTAPDLRKRMNFWHFLKVLQNSWNLQNLLESPPGTCMWNLEQFGEVSIFDRKMPTAPDLRKRMKFWHFLKVLRNSWNLQNLLESPPGTCMWNLRSLEKFQFLTEKCRQRRTLEKGWTFDIFSKVSKIHETYRIYWNHLQKHACEIWSSLEKFQFLTEKCRQRRTLEKGWNFDIFSKFSEIHETYRIYWNHLQEHACEIWSSLEKFQFLTEKCWQRRTLEKGWNFDIFSKFSRNSWNLQNLLESLPGHEIWSSLEKFQFLTEKCRQRRTLDKGNFCHFLKVLRNSWNLQNHLQMWNLKQFGEVSIFYRTRSNSALDLRRGCISVCEQSICKVQIYRNEIRLHQITHCNLQYLT